jgi:cytochrome c-type biogenesis protein CcmH
MSGSKGRLRWRSLLAISSLLLCSSLTPLALAAQDSLEERARRLESRLVAPCCFRQVLTMHDSEPAQTMKVEIRRALEAGRSDEEILRGYVDRYGIQILSEPPAVGFHRILSVAPPVLFAVGLAVVLAVLYRWRRGTPGETPPVSLPDDVRRRIEQELDSL